MDLQQPSRGTEPAAPSQHRLHRPSPAGEGEETAEFGRREKAKGRDSSLPLRRSRTAEGTLWGKCWGVREGKKLPELAPLSEHRAAAPSLFLHLGICVGRM